MNIGNLFSRITIRRVIRGIVFLGMGLQLFLFLMAIGFEVAEENIWRLILGISMGLALYFEAKAHKKKQDK